jgi:hypothetical protein
LIVKRAVVLLFVLVLSGCVAETGIDKAKFKTAEETAKAVRTSVVSGASYGAYRESVERFAAAVYALKGTAGPAQEQKLIKAYSDLLSIYRDYGVLWNYKLEFAPFDFIPQGRIYVGQAADPIVSKYQLSTESHVYRPTGQHWTSVAEDSLQIIWRNAEDQLKIIEDLTSGPRM